MTNICSDNISHQQRASSFEMAKQSIAEKIQRRGNLPYVTTEKQLEILEQLSNFDPGRFLIERGGLNGFWTHYIISHPLKGRITRLDHDQKPFNPIAEFLLNKAPVTLATQQRFVIFKETIQKHLREGCSLASVPCGVMGDLLELDYSKIKKFSLHGIDLDSETLSQAKIYAEERHLANQCSFTEADAWSFDAPAAFDLISSNGLNIYEPDDDKVIQLYRHFHDCLKPQGVLVTSFLTPPPLPGMACEWKLDQVNSQDALLQKIILSDIISGKWQVYRSEEKVKSQLAQAGFKEITIIYDDAHVFPTVIAKKG